MLATMFAISEGVHAALRDQRPADQRPLDKRLDFPHYYANDLRARKAIRRPMSSEYSKLWEDSVAREVYGLLVARMFEPV